MGFCGSPATPCCTTASARSPTASKWTPPLLHLGCVRFPVTGPIRYTMTAQEAVELCRLVRPRTAIPVHYEGWTHFHQDRPAIVAEFAQAPADIGRRLQWLPFGAPSASRGEHTRLAPGRPVSERLTSPLTVDGDPATTLLGTAVSRNLLAQRKPGIQLPSPPPPNTAGQSVASVERAASSVTRAVPSRSGRRVAAGTSSSRRPVVAGGQQPLGGREPEPVGDALPERVGGHLHPRRVPVLRVPGVWDPTGAAA
jgi:hypothetical protein